MSNGVLDENLLLRNSGHVKGREAFGIALRFPEFGPHSLEAVKQRYPDLGSPDKEIKYKAWKKFAASSASLPYRTGQT